MKQKFKTIAISENTDIKMIGAGKIPDKGKALGRGEVKSDDVSGFGTK